jgi:hypothetical protein
MLESTDSVPIPTVKRKSSLLILSTEFPCEFPIRLDKTPSNGDAKPLAPAEPSKHSHQLNVGQAHRHPTCARTREGPKQASHPRRRPSPPPDYRTPTHDRNTTPHRASQSS